MGSVYLGNAKVSSVGAHFSRSGGTTRPLKYAHDAERLLTAKLLAYANVQLAKQSRKCLRNSPCSPEDLITPREASAHPRLLEALSGCSTASSTPEAFPRPLHPLKRFSLVDQCPL
jgi:hypothetical protein